MYKIYTIIRYGRKGRFRQILRVMKLTAFILFAALMQVSASSIAQRLTLVQKNITLKQVFTEINKQTGYTVVWSSAEVNADRELTVDFNSTPLLEVLDKCVESTNLTYTVENKTVVIRQKNPSLLDKIKSALNLPITNTITGKVFDETGQPLPGATVKEKGTNNAVITDTKGLYTITVSSDKSIITFSYIGYEPQELQAKDIANGSVITLKATATNLHEVVINKGYYTEKQRLSVGDVSSVSGEDINKQPVSDPILALEGRVAGLSISQSSGVPGAYSVVLLRGQNFMTVGGSAPITANDPLYVVDGVPFGSESLTSPFIGGGVLQDEQQASLGGQARYQTRFGVSPFSILNPADIESIDVLKDADATAIYGARGANGVILITTKKGRAGPVKVNVNYSSGTSQIATKLDLMNTQQYLEMRREAFKNDGYSGFLTPQFAIYIPDLLLWDDTRYTNWQKELVDRPASFSNTQVQVSGGNTNISYLIGAGYSRQGTTFPGDYSNQAKNLFINLSSSSANQRFHISFSASYGNNDNNVPGTVDIVNAVALPPDAPPLYDANGNLNWAVVGGSNTWKNPLSFTSSHFESATENLIGNLSLQYRILDGLELSARVGYNKSQMNSQFTNPSAYNPPPDNVPINDILRLAVGNSSVWNVEPQLSYHRLIGKGALDLLAGTTFQDQNSSQFANKYDDFSSDAFINNPIAAVNKALVGYSLSEYKYNSIYGRIGYNWEEKYLLNLTARRDGSSRFGPNKEFGDFSSLGLGWVFSKEKFVEKGLPWLSFGKMRASYGSVGSDAIGDYQFVRTYSFNGPTYQNTQTISPNGHANPYFQWQSTRKLEFGLELGLLRDKVNFSASYYRNRTGNQLVNSPLPDFTGFSTVVENLPAVVQNSGWEFTANTTNLKSSHFRWNSSFNISFQANKLISFPGIENTSYNNIYAVGQSLSSILVYHYLGVDPQIGTYSFAAKSGTNNPVVGVDQNWSKPFAPQYFGGLGNSFNYKGFSLDIFFQFVKQRGLYTPSIGGAPGTLSILTGNQPVSVLDRWQNPGDHTNIQQFTASFNPNANQAFAYFTQSDGAITDASFIRLKNVSLSYSMPDSWQKKLHLRGMRIFLQTQNLLTITKYPGWDPENAMTFSVPPYRTITGGVEISL